MKKLTRSQLSIKTVFPHICGALVFLIATALNSYNVLNINDRSLERTLDLLTNVSPFDLDHTQEDYVFIDIDEQSLASLGQWPWPRTIFAELAQNILYADPAVVGVDILLAEPDRFNPNALKTLTKNQDIDLALFFENGDEILSRVFDDEKIVLATALSDRQKNTVKQNARIIIKNQGSFDLRSSEGIIFPIDMLDKANGFGFVNVDVSRRDTVVRMLPLVTGFNEDIHPSFVLEIARAFEEDSEIKLERNKDLLPKNIIQTGFLTIPVMENGNFILHHGYSSRFQTISISEFQQTSSTREAVSNLIEDKIVIIGSSASGLNDLHSSNLESAIPGPLIHLSAIQQILAERYIFSSAIAEKLFFVLLSILLLILFVVIGKDRIFVGLMFTLAISSAAFLGTVFVFIEHGLLLNLNTTVCFFGSSLITLILLSTIIAANKRALQSAFGSYLAPDMVKEIVDSGRQPELGGTKKELSVVMTDMRNFTALGESYGTNVEEFTRTMNRYMTAIAEPVFKNRGTLVKFIGDASLHIHGAPIDDSEHAFRSVKTALEMINAVHKFNSELASEGKPPVGLGAGVNTGEILVGNIGAAEKFGYDVLGDPVSVAARLEGQTKAYGVLLIVGPKTQSFCVDKFDWWELDNIAVKGKDEPLKIYTVARQGQEHKNFLSHYYAGDWTKALQMMSKYKDAAPDMIQYYGKMEERLRKGLPDDWDGIYRAASK